MCVFTSSVLHQVMQLLGMLQKLQPPGTLTLAPGVHCFWCSGVCTLRRQLEKYCSDPTFTYTLTQIYSSIMAECGSTSFTTSWQKVCFYPSKWPARGRGTLPPRSRALVMLTISKASVSHSFCKSCCISSWTEEGSTFSISLSLMKNSAW